MHCSHTPRRLSALTASRPLSLRRNLKNIISAGAADLSEIELTYDDLIIAATPVSTILRVIEELPQTAPEGCMIMDIGSTKWDICRAMNGLPGRFQAIGGHPMCGREVSGFGWSSAELYQDQTFILTPTARTTPHLKDIALDIIAAIGAKPVQLAPRDHDRSVAIISHLPYLISSTLMQQAAIAAGTDDTLWHVSASGFRDTGRLSGSNPTMMRDIILTNREAIVQQLLRFQRELSGVIEMVNSAEAETLINWMEQNRTNHTRYLATKNRQKTKPDD